MACPSIASLMAGLAPPCGEAPCGPCCGAPCGMVPTYARFRPRPLRPPLCFAMCFAPRWGPTTVSFLCLPPLCLPRFAMMILLSLDSEERLTARGRDPELLIQTLRPRGGLRQIQSLL